MSGGLQLQVNLRECILELEELWNGPLPAENDHNELRLLEVFDREMSRKLRKKLCIWFDFEVLPNDVDLLYPSVDHEKRKHKLKCLVQSPNSFFMDVKCQGCFNISRGAICSPHISLIFLSKVDCSEIVRLRNIESNSAGFR
ncbi:hypothetical protein K7X08_031475 [Anisodus acutangulus]|uniref:Uncharacterized protein n=1 Tax=Anisodus acutangulus TaxID=402998 RepID=A0A9Q1MLF5_9SOLA|nr:hypothetical protein K7X08_031475 [Anisodus acutangulus]